jgi:hypothetical protein
MSLIQCCCVNCTYTITILGCSGLPIPAGQSVVVKLAGVTIATLTTDASGNITLTVAAGTYNFSATRARFTALNTNLVLDCLHTSQSAAFPSLAAGYHCIHYPGGLSSRCPDPLADTLFLTVSTGQTATLVNTGGNWVGSSTVAGGTDDWTLTSGGALSVLRHFCALHIPTSGVVDIHTVVSVVCPPTPVLTYNKQLCGVNVGGASTTITE